MKLAGIGILRINKPEFVLHHFHQTDEGFEFILLRILWLSQNFQHLSIISLVTCFDESYLLFVQIYDMLESHITISFVSELLEFHEQRLNDVELILLQH